MTTTLDSATFPLDSLREAAPHLRRPFAPAAVNFKVQTQTPKDNPTRGIVVAYIDMRLVVERLNLIVPHLWHDAYEPLEGGKGLICRLTVDGITRVDVGQGDDPKALYSDALKRAAVKFGIGVPIYALAQVNVQAGDGTGKAPKVVGSQKKRLLLTDDNLATLRRGYEGWLERTGERSFGPVLDHGDEEGSQGAEDAPPAAPANVDPETGEVTERDGAVTSENGAPTEDELRAMMRELGMNKGKVDAKIASVQTPAARTALSEQLSAEIDAQEDE